MNTIPKLSSLKTSSSFKTSKFTRLHSSHKQHATQNRKLHEVVIVSAVRTPIGSIGGQFASLTAPQLGSIAISGALSRISLSPKEVQEVYMGNVLQAGQGQAPVRQAVIGAGLPDTVCGTTINKVCASGMKAVMLASQNIMLGQQDIMVAGGMESMSNVPYYMDKARYGYKYGNGTLMDGILKDGLMDVYNNIHMGQCAEHCSKTYNISRQDQDNHAIESYRRVADATKNGHFKAEIVPVTIEGKKGEKTVITEDEEYKKVNFDKIPTLRPAFDPKGTVTAANSSKLNDGAAALVLMSRKKAQEMGFKPLARVLGFADAARAPIEFTVAPSQAIPLALKKAGVSQKDVDYYEINEAFSVISVANNRLLNLDPAKVNLFGGAVALGHPIGCSGARVLTTLIHVMQIKNARIGVGAICNGGGEASAVVLEKM